MIMRGMLRAHIFQKKRPSLVQRYLTCAVDTFKISAPSCQRNQEGYSPTQELCKGPWFKYKTLDWFDCLFPSFDPELLRRWCLDDEYGRVIIDFSTIVSCSFESIRAQPCGVLSFASSISPTSSSSLMLCTPVAMK